MKNFILLGAPGSGKGTQSNYLVKEFGFTHISTGNIIRDNITKKTSLGVLCKYYYDKGKLVSDNIMIKMIKNHLKTVINSEVLIWDGFPRTIVQAKKLDQLFKKLYSKVDRVLYFKIDEIKLINRIIGRLTCSNCGRTYHKTYLLPKVLWVCDDDKIPLFQRKDDNEEKIKTRLAEYHIGTVPLIEYYLNQHALTIIDVNIDKNAVWNQIITALKCVKIGGNK